MIRRTLDVEFVNRIASRDFPGVNTAAIFAEPLHVCLVEDNSAALFMFRGPGIYEVHVLFAARGRAAIALGHQMLSYMREHHGGQIFWAMVPNESRPVKMFTRLMGWESRGAVTSANGPQELFISGKCKCL